MTQGNGQAGGSHAPLKVAFIGAGAMAREHANAFRGLPGVELSGIHSRTRDKAEALAAEFGIGAVYDDVDSLYAGTGADLVVITVFEMAMLDVALAAMAHPWKLFLEKPPGKDLGEAEAIDAAARQHGREVFVALNRRFLGSTLAASADLADDPGRRFVHVQDQQSLETARIIGHPTEVVERWMYANSVHLVDYVSAFCRGAVERVDVLDPWRGDDTEVVLARIAFDSGDLAVYEGLWHAPGPWACTVTTARRRWELRPLEKAVFQNAGERVLNEVEPEPADAGFKPGFRRQAEAVVAAVRGDAARAVTLTDSLQSMRLVRAIYGV